MLLAKAEVVALHEREFEAWQGLLAGLSPARLTNPELPNGLSVKDTLAHLWAWQQRTVARLEAALRGHEPRFPEWPVRPGEIETDEEVDRANAWILEANQNRPWTDVHTDWRENYLRFLELLRGAPAEDFRPEGRLAWAAEYQPLEGHEGSYDCHHAEHRVRLEEWVAKHPAP